MFIIKEQTFWLPQQISPRKRNSVVLINRVWDKWVANCRLNHLCASLIWAIIESHAFWQRNSIYKSVGLLTKSLTILLGHGHFVHNINMINHILDQTVCETSSLWYKPHLGRQKNCWSLRCSCSSACYSNYTFILDLIPGFVKNKTARRDEKHFIFEICAAYIRCLW